MAPQTGPGLPRALRAGASVRATRRSSFRGELHFDNNAEYGLSVDEQHEQVRAVLRRIDVGEVGGLKANLRVRGQGQVQRIAQQLGRELGPVAKEKQQGLVRERRHGRGRTLAAAWWEVPSLAASRKALRSSEADARRPCPPPEHARVQAKTRVTAICLPWTARVASSSGATREHQ
ncbi:MAG: hypothetical protein ABTD50_24080 [Polyangiaceae bacterium]